MKFGPAIDAATLAPLVAAGRVQVIDTRPEAAWREAALPGAMRLDVYDYFIPRSDAAGIAAMAGAVARAYAALGIDAGRPVVFYEEATGMISPRGLWFHALLGRDDGTVLDGGILAWRAAGLPTTPGAGRQAAITPGDDAAAPPGARLDLAASLDDVQQAVARGAVILDTRRPTEHSGAFVHPCCARAGRIPGSRLLFWEDVLHDGRYRDPTALAARFRDAGLDPGQEVIAYCHRGARAATVFQALRLAGFSRPRVFVGSWHEWAACSHLPAELG